VNVPARRIVVTAGASAALQLACLALIDAGDEVLMPDPSYPCNRHFVSAGEGNAVLIPTTAPSASSSAPTRCAAWGPRRGACCWRRPSNPTGTSIAPDELRRIHGVVQDRGGITLIDEIYLGLSYDDTFGHSALAWLDGDIISINSFSKYFNMTGWRLGWMVVPERWCPWSSGWRKTCSSAPAPWRSTRRWPASSPRALPNTNAAAPSSRPGATTWSRPCKRLGLSVPVVPDGAFYAYPATLTAAPGGLAGG
jgi:aspartate/methionine/tyrosine aminotransferase